MLDRWERILGATLSLLLVLGALVASRQPGGSLAPAYAAGSWSGASAPGSGQAPWETFDQGVNVATGNLLVEGDGVAFPQINGMDLAVAPVYNSLSKGVTTDLGHGWLLGTGRDVGLVFGSGVVTFYDGTGHGWAFSSPGSCVFTPPAGIDAQLACSGSNYLLTDNVSGAQLQFDANGYLTAARNRVGNQVSFTYDANGRLTQITGPVSPGTQYVTVSYNAQNLISQVRDPNGRTWGYGYSAAGDLTGVTDPAGNVWQYAYDATHTLTRITDARGNYSLFTYDGAGRVSTIVDVTNTGTNTGPNWTVTYPSGSSTQVTDPNNHTTTYGFDGAGPVTSIIHPDSTVTQATWTADNHLATVQLPSGATTTYSYDSLNNLTKVTYPSGAHEDWVYGDSGHPYLPTVYYDPQGNPRSFSYNPNGTLAVTGDATGHTASLAYNGDGTVQSVTDENGHVTGYGYTALGLPSSTTYPGPRGAESYSYNADNLLSSETDGKGQTTTHSYDALGQETSLGSADGSAVGSSYDANGNEIQMVDSQTHGQTGSTQAVVNGGFEAGQSPWQPTASSFLKFNAAGAHSGSYYAELKTALGVTKTLYQTVTLPADYSKLTLSYWVHALSGSCSGWTAQVRTIGGTPIATVPVPCPSGATGGYAQVSMDLTAALSSYRGQQVQVFFQNGADAATFDLDDVSLSAGAGTTVITNDTYNTLDQLTQEQKVSASSVETISYTRDGVDNLLTKTDGSGTTTYTYTVNDELATVKDPLGNQTAYTYDQDGNRTKIAYPGGVAENLSYDGDGKLTRIWGTNPSGGTIDSFSYSYANPYGGNAPTFLRWSMADAAGKTTSYFYDPLDRLTSATEKDGTGATTASYSYAYDPVGNITSQTLNGAATTFSYNAADQLTQATGAINKTYTYDANGNRLTETGGNTYAYDPLDQTTSVTPNGGSAISMGYTATGQAERTSNGNLSYRYDETGLYSLTDPGQSNFPRYFTTGPDGELIGERVPYGATAGNYSVYYYLFDGLGSVVGLVDGSGNLVDQYSYDPYGNVRMASETVPNPYRFAGGLWDASTGLDKMGERYYDPSVGRFTQTDPLDGRTYTYADGDPINLIDPSGLVTGPPIEEAGGEAGPSGSTPDEAADAGSAGDPAPEEQCSFSSDTLVATSQGDEAIGQIEPGDAVLAFDPATGQTGGHIVTAVWEHQDAVIELLTINGETLTTTPEHPFYTRERGWVVAGRLWKGAHVREESGRYGVVGDLRSFYHPQPMYNLTVDTAHTYFVGHSRWLVHNTCGEPKSGGREETPQQRAKRIRRTKPENLNDEERTERAKMLREEQKDRNKRPEHTRGARKSTYDKHTRVHGPRKK